MKNGLHRALILLGCVLPVAGLFSAELQVVEEDRFVMTVLTDGLPQPMEVDVAADGRVFFIELGGKLKIVRPADGKIIEAASLDVFTEQENGLIGLALAPDFAKSSQLYLLYSPKGETGQRVSRFTMNGEVLDLASEKILLRINEQRRQCCHHAGAMEFGPDGCLYISSGDNTNPFESKGYSPIDERADRDPWDAQKSSANMNDLRGGVVRIRPRPDGTYEIPEGNLFPPGTEGTRPEVYVKGCRNPWRISVDQKTGYLYWGDVGPDAGGNDDQRGPRGHDEVNQARAAGFFGWPYFVADNQAYYDWDFTQDKPGHKYDMQKPVNESPNNTGRKDLPPAQPAFIYYPGGNSEKFPELGSGGRTACAGPVYYHDAKKHGATGFPAQYDHTLFIFEWSRHWIMAVHLDEKEQIKLIEPFMPSTSFKRPVDMVFGPKGEMYLLEYGDTWGPNRDSRLVKIEYIRGNRAPVARASAGNDTGVAPLKVRLSSTGSMDRDKDDALSYAWRRKPGGPVESKVAECDLVFETPGVYTVELTVTDKAGAAGIAQVPVMVGNARPKLRIVEPEAGSFYEPEKPLNVRVEVEDDQPSTGQNVFLKPEFSGSGEDGRLEPAGLSLMRRSDCFNCHATGHKIVGPPLVDVAKKYNKDAAALEVAAQRVIAGSSGVWGVIPMLPHPQHGIEDSRQMVQWIFSLADEANDQVKIPVGAAGQVAAPKAPEGLAMPNLRILATYTDPGAPLVGPLAGSTMIELRPARLEAEMFDSHQGLQILGTGDSGHGQRMLGSIRAGSHTSYKNIHLAGIRRVICRVASAGTGGQIQFRAGAKDGELLGSVDVWPTGGWDKFIEVEAALKDPDRAIELFVVFHRAEGGGGLMNLNWMHFRRD